MLDFSDPLFENQPRLELAVPRPAKIDDGKVTGVYDSPLATLEDYAEALGFSSLGSMAMLAEKAFVVGFNRSKRTNPVLVIDRRYLLSRKEDGFTGVPRDIVVALIQRYDGHYICVYDPTYGFPYELDCGWPYELIRLPAAMLFRANRGTPRKRMISVNRISEHKRFAGSDYALVLPFGTIFTYNAVLRAIRYGEAMSIVMPLLHREYEYSAQHGGENQSLSAPLTIRGKIYPGTCLGESDTETKRCHIVVLYVGAKVDANGDLVHVGIPCIMIRKLSQASSPTVWVESYLNDNPKEFPDIDIINLVNPPPLASRSTMDLAL